MILILITAIVTIEIIIIQNIKIEDNNNGNNNVDDL